MVAYIIRRLLISIPTLFGITVLAFVALAMAPGDPITALIDPELKTLAFHDGVNVTLGLPIVRTSPDHGVALSIAGTGEARADSLIAAIHMAGEIAARRGL